MDWSDFLAPMVKWPTEGVKAGVDYASQQMGGGSPLDEIPGYKDRPMPQVGGPNPYQGRWDDLIQQLSQRAAGRGPSLAGDAYQQANNKGMEQVSTMSHGRGPGAAYGAARAAGDMTQNLAGGYARARNEEMVGAQGQLAGALGGAQAGWMAPQAMSLQAWATQQGLDMAKLQALASLLGGGARMAATGGASAATGGGGGMFDMPPMNIGPAPSGPYGWTPDHG